MILIIDTFLVKENKLRSYIFTLKLKTYNWKLGL